MERVRCAFFTTEANHIKKGLLLACAVFFTWLIPFLLSCSCHFRIRLVDLKVTTDLCFVGTPITHAQIMVWNTCWSNFVLLATDRWLEPGRKDSFVIMQIQLFRKVSGC